MSPVQAALKSLFQCRPAWFWHIWGVVICAVVLSHTLSFDEAPGGAVIGLLIIPLWIGVLAASLFKDFATRPFSFALPSHHRVWRRTLMSIALVIACFSALLSLFGAAGSATNALTTAWLAFILSLTAFMSALIVAFRSSNTSFLPAVISLVMILVFNENLSTYTSVSIGGALLANPVVITIVCAAILYLTWREMGSRGFRMKMCGRPFLGLQSTFNGARMADYQTRRKLGQMRRPPGRLTNSLERFYLSRIRSKKGDGSLKSLWGSAYLQASKWSPAAPLQYVFWGLSLAAVTVALGYYHPVRLEPGVSGANLMLFLLCALSSEYKVNPHASLLLNLSRRDRFRSLVFSGLMQWLVIALFAAVLTVVSILAGRYLPDVTAFDKTYPYESIHPKAFFIFAPVIPFYFLSQVLFPKFHVIALIFIITGGVLLFFAVGRHLLGLSVPVLLLIQMVNWLPFVLFIRHYCYRGDLKLNGR